MNKEFLGDRRRALEEEYFSKLNRALLERIRSARAAEANEVDAKALNAKAADAKADGADERSEVDGDASSDRLVEEAC